MRVVAILLACLGVCRAATTIAKVEPPDWSVPTASVTLRMLLTGTDLTGARVTSSNPELSAGPVRVSAGGTHAFFDLTIAQGARAGHYALPLRAAGGSVTVHFELTSALPAAGRFQGLAPDDVIYLIMPDRFANGDASNDDPAKSPGLFDRSKPRYYHGGDLAGIRQHLPYLKELGVTALWLTPIYDNADRLSRNATFTDYHGYGAVDFYGVEEHLGTLEEYLGLVDAAHQLGLKVIQDQVANHTGPYHPWVADPPTPGWFHGTGQNHEANTWQTWTLLDPHATAELRRPTLDGWFANMLPDLDQDNPEVRRYLIQNTLWWIGRTGIDAVREDTVPYVPRTFWRDWMSAIHRAYPGVRVVGEVFEEDPALPAFFQGGRAGFDGIDTGIDTVFDFPLYGAVRRVFARHQSPQLLARVFAHDQLYPDASRLVTFLGLHDVARFLHEPGATPADLARAFTFLYAARGTPMIYYGDEIGMTGGNDPDNRRDFPGGWPGDSHNAFDARGRTPAETALFDHVRRLSRARASSAALRRGTQQDVFADEHSYAFVRAAANEQVLVVVHDAPEPATLTIRLPGFAEGTRLKEFEGSEVTVSGGVVKIPVERRAVLLFSTVEGSDGPRPSTAHQPNRL